MIVHLVTQRNQPYGSVRKCCEVCGCAISTMDNDERYVESEGEYENSTFVRCDERPGENLEMED